jgi:hypothetical protein
MRCTQQGRVSAITRHDAEAGNLSREASVVGGAMEHCGSLMQVGRSADPHLVQTTMLPRNRRETAHQVEGEGHEERQPVKRSAVPRRSAE